MKLFVTSDTIENHYRVLSEIGNLGPSLGDGFLRAAYSDQETEAMRYFERQAKDLNLLTVWDEVGNLYVEAKGQTNEYVETGSHIDTVPMGGNFDGAAGIVAGFEAIKQLCPLMSSLKRGVRLRIWRAEESATFGVVYCGSTAAFGKLDPKSLARRFNGKSLEDAMGDQGVNLEYIHKCKPSITQSEIDNIYSHIELHIEQGNLLDVKSIDIGVVTSIRGPRRTRVTLSGEFDHSGATPMGTDFRRDVNLAMAHMLVRLDALANEKLREGADLVQTIGVINSEQDFSATHPAVYQNAVTKVSGYGYFTLDIRSVNNTFRQEYCQAADQIIHETAKEFRVADTIELISSSSAVESVDAHIQELCAKSCDELGYSFERMPSGAGHDCVVVSQQKKSNATHVPIGMLFIPCRSGKSHSPDEFASFEAIAKGSSVLAQTLYKLASE